MSIRPIVIYSGREDSIRGTWQQRDRVAGVNEIVATGNCEISHSVGWELHHRSSRHTRCVDLNAHERTGVPPRPSSASNKNCNGALKDAS